MNYLQDFQQAGTGHYELLQMGKPDLSQQTGTLSAGIKHCILDLVSRQFTPLPGGIYNEHSLQQGIFRPSLCSAFCV